MLTLVCFRYAKFDKLLKQIDETEGGIDQFTQGYKTFGIHINADNSVSCKEWAPGAFQLYLYGDFSMCNSNIRFFRTPNFTLNCS